MDGKQSETFIDEDKTKCLSHTFYEESTGKPDIFCALSFPEKLWVLGESYQFESIWWGHSRKCVVINEVIFQVEVLGRRGP